MGGANACVAGEVPQAGGSLRAAGRRADMHEAFLLLGCSLICLNYLA